MKVKWRYLYKVLFVFVALFMAAVLAFAVNGSAGTTTIFVNGTWSKLAYPGVPPPDNSGKIAQGQFQNSDTMVVIDYLRAAGILTGLNDVSYDVSVNGGGAKAVNAVLNARMNDPTGHTNLAGESQGADAVLRALKALEDIGFDTSNIDFYVFGNVDNNDGGLLTRLQFLKGLYIPLIGVTYGAQPTEPQYSHVIEVSNQYDGATDVPKYILNLPADINAFLGAFLYGTHVYNHVDINDPNNVVMTNSSGNVTNIFVPFVGTLPILRPLLQMGVPREVVDALGPLMSAIIETGYDRPDPSVPGSYPDHPVGAQLLPGPDQWVQDTVSIMQGLTETLHRLGALAQQAVQDRLNPPPAAPVTTQNSVLEQSRVASAPSGQATSPDESEPIQVSENQTLAPKVAPESKNEPQDPSGDNGAVVGEQSKGAEADDNPPTKSQNAAGSMDGKDDDTLKASVESDKPSEASETVSDTSDKKSSDDAGTQPTQKRHRPGDGIKRALEAIHRATHAGMPKKAPSSIASKGDGTSTSSDGGAS